MTPREPSRYNQAGLGLSTKEGPRVAVHLHMQGDRAWPASEIVKIVWRGNRIHRVVFSSGRVVEFQDDGRRPRPTTES